MNFHVLTLFPEMILQGMQTSILGRAVLNGYITLDAVDIRAYTENKHKKVDDYPYGGGAGMLMQAQPVYDACQAVKRQHNIDGARVIYLTPQGRTFNQKMAEELSEENNLIFLCGHYEGIDERVLEEIVTDYVSVGDYVLTGGELPAMIMIDAIARLVPGVLNNGVSADFETFHNDLLEYPQYSRPEIWRGKEVPQILLSGNHAKIESWRLEQSVARTKEKRPDLYEKYVLKQYYTDKLLKKNKLLYMDIIENLRRGRGELIYAGEDGIAVRDDNAGVYMLAAFDDAAAEKIVECIPCIKGKWQFVIHQESLLEPMERRFTIEEKITFNQAVYTNRVTLPVSKQVTFKPLDISYLKEVTLHYDMVPAIYMQERLCGGNIFGAFLEGELAGFAGVHKEGSLGILEVYERFRRQGIAAALEAYMINYHLSCGYTPYCDIVTDNESSMHLQRKMGLRISDKVMFWVTAEEKGGM